MADGWDPDVYARFQAERRQPFEDLLALVAPAPGGQVVDLGCGTGELTTLLHRHVGAAQTVGVDSSAAMLKDSNKYAGGGLSFQLGDIATFDGSGYDVVFANASLHWVPDHETLLGRLSHLLAPGGQLAFQVPANFDHPSHLIATEVANEAPFASSLGPGVGDQGVNVLPPETYAVRLHQLGFAQPHVRLQVYGHHLASTSDVVEWVKGTLLTPYREHLSSDAYDEFVDRYRQRLLERLGDQRPYFYPFKRILCCARRPYSPEDPGTATAATGAPGTTDAR